MSGHADVQQPSSNPQPVSPGYAQHPVAQAKPKRSKTPVIIGAVAAVLVAALIGVGFATNWFGFAGQPAPSGPSGDSSTSPESALATSEKSEPSSPTNQPDAQSTPNVTWMPNSAAATKKLIIGFDSEYPPFSYSDGDQYIGLDIDLAREVCKRNGWDFYATPIDWEGKNAMLERGEINCVWSALSIEGNEGAFTFSEPYMKSESNERGEGIKTYNYAVGFMLGDIETAEIVSSTLRDMYRDGTVKRILAKYASQFESETQPIDMWILK